MKRSVSIKFMWAELPWPERVRRAAEAGFDRVELWDWREPDDIDELGVVARECGIEIAGFFGHHQGGVANPDELELVLSALEQAVEVAERVGADQLHIFSDGMRRPEGHVTKPPPLTRDERHLAAVEGLRECVKLVRGKPMRLCVESINTVHVPGYFLEDSDMSVALCREVSDPQVTMFFDCFHQQLVGGRLTDHLLHAVPWLSSVHIADVPGRHQPGSGEINFHYIRRLLERVGYDEQLTFEVIPIDGDSAAAVRAIKEVFPFEPAETNTLETVRAEER
jgi:hydroxypyruvate isomerase